MDMLYFNPGCGLSLYKEEKENQIMEILNNKVGDVKLHKICCHHDPQLPTPAKIINVCAGCHRRFRSLYEGISTISLWEVLADIKDLDLPDYGGMQMSIHDACPIREKPQVHEAIRTLVKRMNIEIIETENHGTKSVCCGDDFYGKIPLEEVHQRMKKRAEAMPCDDVVVYCVSCIKSMHIGGKKPRHILDLIFNEETQPQEYRTQQWHDILNEYIEKH